MSFFEAGTLVTPTIRLVRPLGAGGMGSVWVAEHLALRTQVVVKFMAPDLAESADSTQRFSREAAAAAQVKSPHVVQMLDHGIAQNVPYIVMELLEGHDLRQFLKNHPVPPLDTVRTIIAQTAKALGAAHSRGIVHRDVKPENIFLVNDGSGEIFVKLLDFGIAKNADAGANAASTKSGAMIGTPYYMSPEQLVASKHVDHRADLWSLGVVAHLALTGRLPYVAENLGALVIEIHNAPPPVPSRANPALGPAIDAWFARACAKDPAARFDSAREMADAFAAALRGVDARFGSMPTDGVSPNANTLLVPGTLAPASSSVAAPSAKKRRNAGVLIAGAVLALCGLALLVGLLSARGLAKSRAATQPVIDAAAPIELASAKAVVEPPVIDAGPAIATTPTASIKTKTPAIRPIAAPSVRPISTTPPGSNNDIY